MTDYPSPNMHAGRLRPVRLIIIHTMQCPPTDSATRGSMAYLQRPSVRASCHWGVGPTLTLSGVGEGDTAWAAPGANADGIQIEQAGYATKLNADGSVQTQGSDYTTGDGALIVARTARLVADIAHRHGIPIRHLTDAQLAAGEAGIIGHIQASRVYGGTHWDPGDTYPWDTLIQAATGTTTTVAPITVPKEDTMQLIQTKTPWGTTAYALVTETTGARALGDQEAQAYNALCGRSAVVPWDHYQLLVRQAWERQAQLVTALGGTVTKSIDAAVDRVINATKEN